MSQKELEWLGYIYRLLKVWVSYLLHDSGMSFKNPIVAKDGNDVG